MGLAELLKGRRAAARALTPVTVLVTVLTPLSLLASCTSPERAADVVATVGDAQVTLAEVKARLPVEDTGPPVVRPGVDPPDAWRSALDLAIRDELLSLEGARRDPAARWEPDPAGRAARIRAVVDQERSASPGLAASDITDAEARSWLADNLHLFEEIESAGVTWASLPDADRARQLLDSTVGLDQAGFLALAARLGAETGTAVLDSSGGGADALVARVAFAIRTEGSVGLTTDEDRSWVVRVDSIEISVPPWNDALAGRVRTAMVWKREQAHLDALAEQLRSRWPVSVDEQRFAASRP